MATKRSPSGKKALKVFRMSGNGNLASQEINNNKISDNGVRGQDREQLNQLQGMLETGALAEGVFAPFIVAKSAEKAAEAWNSRPVPKPPAEAGSSSSSSSSTGTNNSGPSVERKGPDDSEDDEDDDESTFEAVGEAEALGRGRTKQPISKEQMRKLVVGVISFAASNSSVGIQNVRSAVAAYKTYAGVTTVHVAALMALGLSSVGSIKGIWAVDMLSTMKALGTVPGIFVGAGGTYKAFLYMGYDILMHMSEDGKRDLWPAWLKTTYDNCDRICPGGNIRNARLLDNEAKETNKNRNAAISAAKTAFAGWMRADSLQYIETLCTIKDDATASATQGVITKFVKPKPVVQGKGAH